jgi:hypothetical protein
VIDLAEILSVYLVNLIYIGIAFWRVGQPPEAKEIYKPASSARIQIIFLPSTNFASDMESADTLWRLSEESVDEKSTL